MTNKQTTVAEPMITAADYPNLEQAQCDRINQAPANWRRSIARTVEAAPPLSPETSARLAALFAGAIPSARGAVT
jgi:hypothetical protein